VLLFNLSLKQTAEVAMRDLRWLACAGALLLLFGLACLNYTKAESREHHREVARSYGLPPPGPAILYGGAAAVTLGAGSVGYAIGRGKRGRA
jgi:hypothetical protein